MVKYILITILILLGTVQSFAENLFETKLKAVILVKVAKNIVYPPTQFNQHQKITICSINKDPLSDPLVDILKIAIKGELIDNKPIEVVGLSDDEKSYSTCNIAFISENVRYTNNITTRLDKSVVIICDYERLLEQGCMIMLALDGNMKSRFMINYEALTAAKVKLTSNIINTKG